MAFCVTAKGALLLPDPLLSLGVAGSRLNSGNGKQVFSVRCTAEPGLDPKVFRKNLTRSKNYNRKGFGFKEETMQLINREYKSGAVVSHFTYTWNGNIIETLKKNSYEYTWGNVTVKLAEAYGFCWGVELAIRIAYEARRQFPMKKIWITNEIIHNPTVNERLAEMQLQIIPVENGKKNLDVVEMGDVVVLPAFGASIQELLALSEKNVQIVDSTCPWVTKVWNTVDKHRKAEYTSVIHGKYTHEETIATASNAGTFIIVKNIKEKFKSAVSTGFDPDRDLCKVGIANQTTMLKGETEEIGKLLERVMMRKYGVETVHDHFMSFNTTCDATQALSLQNNVLKGMILFAMKAELARQNTIPSFGGKNRAVSLVVSNLTHQERQDAMYGLVKEKLDLILVIGGWNSSNTSHLQEIAELKGIPSYWIDNEQRIGPGNKIIYKLNAMEDVLNRVFEIKSKESLHA
ncbi:4-hydroxy-3-methylbut-2-enyl diphosphate reductase [Nymphaea thermarum]|nr:4-hydroxy-3-methylbut-2-enyl diphosphate reductase [Nymphaea thermarum]